MNRVPELSTLELLPHEPPLTTVVHDRNGPDETRFAPFRLVIYIDFGALSVELPFARQATLLRFGAFLSNEQCYPYLY